MYDIESFVDLIVSFIYRFMAVLNEAAFFIGPIYMRLGDVLIAFVLIGIVLNFFWRGAKA